MDRARPVVMPSTAWTRRRRGNVASQKGGDEGPLADDPGRLRIQGARLAIVARRLRILACIQRRPTRQELPIGRCAARRRGDRGRCGGAGGQQSRKGEGDDPAADPPEFLLRPPVHGAGVHLFAPPGKPAYMFG